MSDSYQGMGFWSYVHKDDKAESRRISRLARDVVDQYELLTGETIELFLDQDRIRWGDKWHQEIDGSLASVAFFIPVLTPRYFRSPECRSELQSFARRAEKLGLKELLLPLYYVDIPSFKEEAVKDDLIRIVREFHYEDWRDLRFTEVDSEVYRRGVAKLAERLVEANKRAEEANIDEATPVVVGVADEGGDNALGTIDRMAKMEAEFPRWKDTITDMSDQIGIVGKMFKDATADIDKGAVHGGFSHRVLVARRLARDLSGPTDKISMLANQFTSQLHDVDEGLRTIIEHARVEIQENPQSNKGYRHFFKVVQELSKTSDNALSSTQYMIDSIAPIERMSRDLRPGIRRLRQALTTILEAREVTVSWVGLIEASGIDCP